MIVTYFVHGTSLDNEARLSSGWSNSSLSYTGVVQTVAAAKQIDCSKYDIVICSDLLRAKQSSAILFPDIIPVFDWRLRECNYGVYNGTEHKNVIYQEHIFNPFPDGESLIQVQSRVSCLIDEIKQTCANRRVALIGHRAPQLALEVLSKGIDWPTAISQDWRMVGHWQLGWEYRI